MVKQFFRVKEADQRAIKLHLALCEIGQMPDIEVRVFESNSRIVFRNRSNPDNWDHFTIDRILSMDIDRAKAEGGTLLALKTYQRKAPRPQLPQAEIDEAVSQFLTGEDEQ